jgi:hypothetical protein
MLYIFVEQQTQHDTKIATPTQIMEDSNMDNSHRSNKETKRQKEEMLAMGWEIVRSVWQLCFW